MKEVFADGLEPDNGGVVRHVTLRSFDQEAFREKSN